jgi:ankyrin repeat protein
MRFTRYANTMRLSVAVLGLILLAGGVARGQSEQTQPAEESVPPLCEAARRGDLHKVRTLLRKGVSVDTSSRGTTALMESLLPDIGEPALRMGPPSDQERRAGERQNENKLRIAMLLMASGADVKLADQDGETALHAAAGAVGDNGAVVGVVRELLRRGAVVDARSLAGFTPLQHAVWNKRFEVAKVLVKAGASLDARDGHGKSAADELVAQGSQRVLEDLRRLAARPR